MSSLRKRVAAMLTVAASITGLAIATAPSASAAGSAPYNGACGSGYSVIDSLPLTGGIVYLTYSGATGKNCVVTIRNTAGSPIGISAWVSRADGTGYDSDGGQYTTYAGPVYVSAPGTCINWGGTFNESSDYRVNSHCG
ncbi:spore-associated protein A [Streptomyces sp. NBC_00820]|uniref:spore-associated protein A n=1 Tax=Streptomyces sp. NBC_00820 TaxID=2975842 RepID=UPI002ED3344F|nr:spore-associated protein A [Streptomyces sp. NBC_00820]